MSTNATMRAMLATPTPQGGRYEAAELAVPVPGPRQILVEVKASALNRGEANALAKLVDPSARRSTGGLEFAGVVVGAGEAVTRWKAGDHVMGRAPGGFAQFAVGDERAFLARPATLSWLEAGTVPNVFVTAHDAIVTAGALRPGETVLVTAGSSGVGVAAMQIARYLGAAKVFATSRGTGKAAALSAIGADLVIDTEQPDWVERVLEATAGKGVDMIVDQVGASLLEGNVRALAVGGRLLTVGRNAGAKAVCDLDEIARKNARIVGTSFRTRNAEQTYACIERCGSDLLAGLASRRMIPVIDRVFALDALAEAQAYLRGNAQVGKIAIDVAA